MLRRPLLAILYAVSTVTAPAATITLSFSAPLTHQSEIPPPDLTGAFNPGGAAWASITFDDTNVAAGGSLNAELTWSGLTTEAIMGHIHRISSPAGTGNVLIALFSGNRATTDTVTIANLFISGRQMTALFAGLNLDSPSAGALYFNVHTERNQGGEIRGNITDFQAVPEPGTYATLAVALMLVVVWKRRTTNT
jgi:hypothetical protein